MKTNRFLLLLALFATATLSAQFNDRPSRVDNYTIGLHLGKAWQDADVHTAPGGFGAGLTLGRSYGRNTDFPLGLDLRTRLLYTKTRGMDHYASDVPAGNNALNGTRPADGPDYREFPFVFNNYQTHTAELGVEAGLTLNQLRRNRGIIAGIYGGLGAVWNRAAIDQLDGQNDEYFGPYARIDQGLPRDVTLRNLRNDVFDGHYETRADGYATELGNVTVAPSFGVELGLELTPNLSVVGGHRVTLTGRDNLDGQRWKDPRQDVLHYTSVGLRFNFSRQRQAARQPRNPRPRWNPLPPRRPRPGGGGTTGPVYTPDPIYRSEPTVAWTRPRRRVETEQPTYRVEAQVRAADVLVFEVNGRRIDDFTLEADCLVATVPLAFGQNFLELRASNEDGSARDRVEIFRHRTPLDEPTDPPVDTERPVVRITRPHAQDWTTDAARYTLEATVENVARAAQLRVTQNGTVVGELTYADGRLSTVLKLNPGDNRIRVAATNSSGSMETTVLLTRRVLEADPTPPEDEDTLVLDDGVWENELDLEEAATVLPRVEIQKPHRDRTTTTREEMTLLVDIQSVQDAVGIQVHVNGKPFAPGNFNAKTGRLKQTVALRRGSNVIRFTATNAAGTARDQVVVLYHPKPSPQPDRSGDKEPTSEPRPVVTEPVVTPAAGQPGSGRAARLSTPRPARRPSGARPTGKKTGTDAVLPKSTTTQPNKPRSTPVGGQ